jgi:hypothetical protein
VDIDTCRRRVRENRAQEKISRQKLITTPSAVCDVDFVGCTEPRIFRTNLFHGTAGPSANRAPPKLFWALNGVFDALLRDAFSRLQ